VAISVEKNRGQDNVDLEYEALRIFVLDERSNGPGELIESGSQRPTQPVASIGDPRGHHRVRGKPVDLPILDRVD
jgi:hypothetical protein